MSKAKTTKKTAAHRKAERDVAKLKTGLAYLMKVNVDLHDQIREEREEALKALKVSEAAEASLLAHFNEETARLCVDRSALQATINHLKRQLTNLILARAK